MALTREEVWDAALSLPMEQRLELADSLTISLRESTSHGELSPELLAELKRRSAEMDADPSVSLEWDDVRAEMEKTVPA